MQSILEVICRSSTYSPIRRISSTYSKLPPPRGRELLAWISKPRFRSCERGVGTVRGEGRQAVLLELFCRLVLNTFPCLSGSLGGTLYTVYGVPQAKIHKRKLHPHKKPTLWLLEEVAQQFPNRFNLQTNLNVFSSRPLPRQNPGPGSMGGERFRSAGGGEFGVGVNQSKTRG